jgi:hypothetical protein
VNRWVRQVGAILGALVFGSACAAPRGPRAASGLRLGSEEAAAALSTAERALASCVDLGYIPSPNANANAERTGRGAAPDVGRGRYLTTWQSDQTEESKRREPCDRASF